MIGRVKWYDINEKNNDGEGQILDLYTGAVYYVYQNLNIKNNKHLEKGQLVEFTLYTNLYMSQIETIELIDENAPDMIHNDHGCFYTDHELHVDADSCGYWYTDQDGGDGPFFDLIKGDID